MVDAVHDEQHVRWVLLADIDLTLRRESPVKSHCCCRCDGCDGAGGGHHRRRGRRDQIFAEERDERGSVRRRISAHQGSECEREESRSGADVSWI